MVSRAAPIEVVTMEMCWWRVSARNDLRLGRTAKSNCRSHRAKDNGARRPLDLDIMQCKTRLLILNRQMGRQRDAGRRRLKVPLGAGPMAHRAGGRARLDGARLTA